ncbi:MAG: hypothetical protein WD052_11095 [Bacteroidales bacterium]
MKIEKYEEKLLSEAAAISTKNLARKQGSVAWSSPSNIALVKYWGKYPGQIPANASLSMTLDSAVTIMKLDYTSGESINGPVLNFEFEGSKAPDFAIKLEKYLQGIVPFMPWLDSCKLSIRSENTFPHSSGIASSASSMSALALGLCEIEELLYGEAVTDDFLRKASFIARLGSGSASRSLYGKMAAWGITASYAHSSDEYAIPVEIHEDLSGMHDSILIIDPGQKMVSSTMGHELMRTNPYAKLRFEAAEANMQLMADVLKIGDTRKFIDVMENEALSLHAMMMTGIPGYILIKPNTLEAIQRIRKFRNSTGTAIGFTLDAGANVHVLYPEKAAAKARLFIESELKEICDNEKIIHDKMGNGPVRVER